MARLTPFASLTSVLGAVPYAILARNHRGRVVLVAFWVGLILTFLLAGFGSATQVVVMALFGFVAGRASRDRRSRTWSVGMSVALGWSVVAGLTLGFLSVFGAFRRLTFESTLVQLDGASVALSRIGFGRLGDLMTRGGAWAFDHWVIGVPLFQLGISILLALFLRHIAAPTLALVGRSSPSQRPTPVVPQSALEQLTAPGLTVVVGPNGSGKTALLDALAHTTDRGGLGERGGVAVIGQRPETQIVGARVRDDLAWGLHPAPSAQAMADVLTHVGLEGFEEAETTTLSGGQMQRLAIASALLRKPALLLSDESTAMLDPETRSVVRDLLVDAARGASVVHASHLDADLAIADRVLDLEAAPLQFVARTSVRKEDHKR